MTPRSWGIGHRIAHRDERLEPLHQRHRPLLEDLGQGLASDELHREGRGPLLGPFQAVDRHDVRVIELRGHLGFGQEARRQGPVARNVTADDLERDDAAEIEVVRREDIAHAARADVADDIEVLGCLGPGLATADGASVGDRHALFGKLRHRTRVDRVGDAVLDFLQGARRPLWKSRARWHR